MSLPNLFLNPELFQKRIRVVYADPAFLEHLVEKASKKYGCRAALYKALGYVYSSSFNKALSGKKGMLASRFLKLCELAGVRLEETQNHVSVLVFYGQKGKINLIKLDKKQT